MYGFRASILKERRRARVVAALRDGSQILLLVRACAAALPGFVPNRAK